MMGGKKRDFMARANGGHVGHADEAEDKTLIRKELRGAKIKPSARKAGGSVKGHEAAERPDRKARGGMNMVANAFRERGIGIPSARSAMAATRANGGAMNGVAHVDRRYKAEGISQPHGPAKRARGGEAGNDDRKDTKDEKKGKKHGVGNVTIVINTQGDQQAQQIEKQQAMQQGAQLGARAVAQRLAAAGGGAPPGAGGPPPGAMPPGAGGPPPGAMPPGAMPPGAGAGPPMGGAPPAMAPRPGMAGPPPGAAQAPMAARPPMVMPRKDGGGVRLRERSHERRVGGAV